MEGGSKILSNTNCLNPLIDFVKVKFWGTTGTFYTLQVIGNKKEKTGDQLQFFLPVNIWSGSIERSTDLKEKKFFDSFRQCIIN